MTCQTIDRNPEVKYEKRSRMELCHRTKVLLPLQKKPMHTVTLKSAFASECIL